MISAEYREMYDVFMDHYKSVHIDPWHEISENELKLLYSTIISGQEIVDDYSFSYLMNFIIKRLSGVLDAHTQYGDSCKLPINFRMFDDEIIVNYPNDLRGAVLRSINGIDISRIIEELDDVITYGTDGKKKYEIEKALFDEKKLFAIPLLRRSDALVMDFETKDNGLVTKKFEKQGQYSEQEMFDQSEYLYGDPGTYRIEGDNLIIIHSSVQNRFKEKIESTARKLGDLDLSGISKIIVDIRGNTGGNSANNRSLMAFLKSVDKKIICLTDYRVFSGGRYALLDLIELGATTIGTEISTPLNCFGNSNWVESRGHWFSSSSSFLAPNYGWGASSKEEYAASITDKLITPVFFRPDILIEQSREDYLEGIDTVLEYAKKI